MGDIDDKELDFYNDIMDDDIALGDIDDIDLGSIDDIDIDLDITLETDLSMGADIDLGVEDISLNPIVTSGFSPDGISITEEDGFDIFSGLDLDLEEDIEEVGFDYTTIFGDDIIGTSSIEMDMLNGIDIDLGSDIDLDAPVMNTLLNDTTEAISKQTKILSDAGFEYETISDQDQLKYFVSRANNIARFKDISGLFKVYANNVVKLKNMLAVTSSIRSASTEEPMDRIKEIIKNHDSSSTDDKEILELLKGTLSVAVEGKHYTNFNENDVKAIIEKVLDSVYRERKDLDNPHDKVVIENYLKDITRTVLLSMKNANYQNNKIAKYKEQMSIYLIQNEVELVNEYGNAIRENGNVIKQILKISDDKYYGRCGSCGELFELKGVQVEILNYGTRSIDDKPMCFPKATVCKSCGSGHTFLEKDYEEIAKFHKNENKHSIEMFRDQASIGSIGTPILRNNLSINTVIRALPNLVVDVRKMADFKFNEEVVTFDATSLEMDIEKKSDYVDETEFTLATKEFYKKLDKYNTKSLSDIEVGYPVDEFAVLGTPVLAYHVAMSMGKDYSRYKKQAIISLVTELNEIGFYNEALNMEEYWKLKTYVSMIEEVPKNLDLIDSSQRFNLTDWYMKYTGEDVATEEFSLVFDKIKSIKQNLLDRINYLEDLREYTIQLLENNIKLMGHTTILNVSSCSLKLFSDFITEPRLVMLADQISDYMIINNLSKDFYNVWRTYDIISTSTLRDAVENTTDSNKMQTKLQGAFDKKNPNLLDNRPLSRTSGTRHPVLDTLLDRYSIIYRQTVYDLEPIAKIVKAINAYDYYRACELAISLLENKELLDSINFVLYDDHKEDVIKALKALSRSLNRDDVSYYKFYLSDFSDALIEKNKEVLNLVDFGRFILKRKTNEPMLKYLDRFKLMKSKNELNKSNSYDMWDYFEPVMKEIGVLTTVLRIYDMGYSRYAETMFMSRTLESIAELDDRRMTAYLLGIKSSTINIIISEFSKQSLFKFNSSLGESCTMLGTIPITSSIESLVREWYNSYKQELIHTNDNFNISLNSYNPLEFIDKIVSRPETEFINANSDVIVDTDKEYAIVELISYFKDYEEMYDILQGARQ